MKQSAVCVSCNNSTGHWRGGEHRGGGRGGRGGNREMDRPWITPGLRQEILKTKVNLILVVLPHKENLLPEPGKCCKKGQVGGGSGSAWRAAGENGSITRGIKGFSWPIGHKYFLMKKIENQPFAGALVGTPPWTRASLVERSGWGGEVHIIVYVDALREYPGGQHTSATCARDQLAA